MKKIFTMLLTIVLSLSALVIFNACDNWSGYTEVKTRAELLTAIADEQVTKIKLVEGNYGSSSDYRNIVITRPITIKGAGNKPVIFGSIVVKLADTETNPVTIENLEISHSGQYVLNSTTNTVDLTLDGRRGVLVQNGGINLINNHIHLTDQNPTTKLTTAPTGLQLSVSATSTATYQSGLTYNITNNRFGKYAKTQTTATSDPTGIVGVVDTNEALNIDRAKMDTIYSKNTFDTGTDCLTCIFDYANVKYTQGIFSSEAMAKAMMGDNYEYLATGLEVRNVNNVWKIVPTA